MDLSNFRSLLALAAITFTLALNAPSGRADQIIDNFEDGNYVAETYGNNPNGLTEWYGDIATKVLGAGLGVRTRSNSAILNSSNKDAATSGVAGSRHY